MKKDNSHKYEYCVLCHSITPYFQNTDIQKRKYYVKGIGQLCQKCYDKINDNETELIPIYNKH